MSLLSSLLLLTVSFYSRNATHINNILPFRPQVPHRQMVLNLLGYADDPLTLTGIAMDEGQLLKEATACGHQSALNTVHSQRLELAYYFGRYNLASEILDDIKPWKPSSRLMSASTGLHCSKALPVLPWLTSRITIVVSGSNEELPL